MHSYTEISIHALREEGDAFATSKLEPAPSFLSTPSARRATVGIMFLLLCCEPISIHALREEGDATQ